jgi:hypothetical protein
MEMAVFKLQYLDGNIGSYGGIGNFGVSNLQCASESE